MSDRPWLDKFLDGLLGHWDFTLRQVHPPVRVLNSTRSMHIYRVGGSTGHGGGAQKVVVLVNRHISCVHLRSHRFQIIILVQAIKVLVEALLARHKLASTGDWRLFARGSESRGGREWAYVCIALSEYFALE